ncbi:hypothetical protein UFOVP1229_21 [uncultured Caudovirales phage]|uniref:Uncharacterized protein n=1 Tax=uncultured Caudovirales phage TaxID=2100421 RepID=A0A6J5RC73_9CAUD|nr:hypothetical protein UFOVP1229_21 [uncultured Caudovirales phage]
MKLLFVGHAQAGKDHALSFLEQVSVLKNAGTTSLYLAKHIAKIKGCSEQDAYALRREERELWFRVGNEIRQGNPEKLLREAFDAGDLLATDDELHCVGTGGLRDFAEIKAARNVADLIVWVDNMWVPVDPTLKFTLRECDICIPNHWGIPEYNDRLYRFAKTLGILRGQQ